MNLRYVEAQMTRRWHKVYAAIGSNIGDRQAYMNSALDLIVSDECSRKLKVSEFIETKPVGEIEQGDFLNGCLEFETLYEPFELLEFFHSIENALGRTRLIHWGPRTIDLDIIYFDDITIDTPDLTIPHKEMSKRAFVLEPLKELAPYKRHPITQKTTVEMIEELT